MAQLRDKARALGHDVKCVVFRGWFAMTVSEQHALLVVLGLCLLGLTVMWWRAR
jgi:hypothetical protein